jgi:hypothetical protein
MRLKSIIIYTLSARAVSLSLRGYSLNEDVDPGDVALAAERGKMEADAFLNALEEQTLGDNMQDRDIDLEDKELVESLIKEEDVLIDNEAALNALVTADKDANELESLLNRNSLTVERSELENEEDQELKALLFPLDEDQWRRSKEWLDAHGISRRRESLESTEVFGVKPQEILKAAQKESKYWATQALEARTAKYVYSNMNKRNNILE